MPSEGEKKKNPGRPPGDIAQKRQKVRERLWTPNLLPVPDGKPEEIYLPPPPNQSRRSSEYKAWAMECFLELVRHGYNFSQAAEKLGYSYAWWSLNAARHPDWADEARAIAANPDERSWQPPDLSHMDFATFVKTYGNFELAEHQTWIAAALEDPLGKLVLILGHPESGKSTLVSLWYVLYRIAQNPDIRIALVSKSSPKAQDLLTRVKRYLTETHLYADSERNLIEDFQGFKPQHGDLEWSQDQIFIRHRKSGERDPTVQALGIGKQIYGTRLDLLILDDSLVMDNQLSELQRERYDIWFDGEARSRAQKGQTVINGTRLLPRDLYGQWKKAWKDHRLFRFVRIPAILDEYTENERPTWPQYWTLDGYDIYEEHEGEDILVGHQMGLRDIRESIVVKDPNRWRLIYQQEDVEEEENIFLQRHIDMALELGGHRRMGQVFPHEQLVLGVDPATTGRAAAVLIAVDPITKVRTVVDIFVGSQLGATGIRQKLFYQFWDKYKAMGHPIELTVVETNFAPTMLGDEDLKARAALAGTQLLGHTTIARGRKRGSKWDEEFGVAALAGLFGGGLVAFACAGEGDRNSLAPLIDDMLVFPWADVQDALIALWVANGVATFPVNSQVDQEQFAKRRGVPPIILARRRA